jgi:hypothetical protein
MSLLFRPMPLHSRFFAFDDGGFLFELKLDGLRALVVIEHGRAQTVSRNGHRFTLFTDLADDIAAAIRGNTNRAGRRDCLPRQEREAAISGLAISPCYGQIRGSTRSCRGSD